MKKSKFGKERGNSDKNSILAGWKLGPVWAPQLGPVERLTNEGLWRLVDSPP